MGNTEEDEAGTGVDSTIPEHGELLALLKLSVQEVFTSMVFNFCEAVVRQTEDTFTFKIEGEGGSFDRIRVDTEAFVDFHGEVDGTVLLRCTADGAMDIARGLLMMDESEALEVEEVADALGECANMVAGNLKTKGLDPYGKFSISIPRVIDPPGERCGRHRGSLAYRLAQGLISVEIWIDD